MSDLPAPALSRLDFMAARLMRNDGRIARMSIPQGNLLADLDGRHIALIGNARSLAQASHGPAIDAADLVVRINRAPMPSAASHGSRTDWLALATRLSDADRARLDPDRILWMSPKRKRLDWRTASGAGFYLHPLTDYEALRGRLSAPPTTGAMMIDLLLRGPLASLTLYGFDFFASLSLSGRRGAADVPHDFNEEAAWVQDLLHSDSRLTLVR